MSGKPADMTGVPEQQVIGFGQYEQVIAGAAFHGGAPEETADFSNSRGTLRVSRRPDKHKIAGIAVRGKAAKDASCKSSKRGSRRG